MWWLQEKIGLEVEQVKGQHASPRRRAFHWLTPQMGLFSPSSSPWTTATAAYGPPYFLDETEDKTMWKNVGGKLGAGPQRLFWLRNLETKCRSLLQVLSQLAMFYLLGLKISHKTQWDKPTSTKTFHPTYLPTLSIAHSLLGHDIYQRKDGQNAQISAYPLLYIYI